MRYLFFLFALLFQYLLSAQSPYMSQFFSAPTWLNPAFTGYTNFSRLVIQQRNQVLPNSVRNFSLFSYDHLMKYQRSGIGGSFFFYNQSSSYKDLGLRVNYSYILPISDGDKQFRLGLMLGTTNKRISIHNLHFQDQFSGFNNTLQSSQDPLLYSRSVTSLDLDAGFLYVNSNSWFGFSTQNLLGKPLYKSSVSDIGFSLHGGVKIDYAVDRKMVSKSIRYIKPSLGFHKTGKHTSFDFGSLIFHDPLLLGAWYRTSFNPSGKLGSLILLTGFKQDKYTFAYSFEYQLSDSQLRMFGIHEFQFAWEYGRYGAKIVKSIKHTLNYPFPKI